MPIVFTDDEVRAAIKAAQPGDVIIVSAGTYDAASFDLKSLDFDSDQPLTIIAADGADVTLVGEMTIYNSSNIEISGLDFQLAETFEDVPEGELALQWQATDGYAVTISDSDNITITEATFTGYEVTQDYYIKGEFDNSRFGLGVLTDPEFTEANGIEKGLGGTAILIKSSDNVAITASTFTDIKNGIEFKNLNSSNQTADDVTSGTVISDNHFVGLQEDGIRGTDHKGTLISDNVFENFQTFSYYPDEPGAEPRTHSDGIQYWSNGAVYGVTDLTITSNIFLQETGSLQTIFGHTRGKAKSDDVQFHSFDVSNNVIFTGSLHGISLGGLVGDDAQTSTVHNNTLIWNGTGYSPQILFSGTSDVLLADADELAAAEYSSYVTVFDNLVQTDGNPVRLRGLPQDQELAFAILNITGEDGTASPLVDNAAFSQSEAETLFAGLFDGNATIDDLVMSDPLDFIGMGSSLTRPDFIIQPTAADPGEVHDPSGYNVIEGDDGDNSITGTAGADRIEGYGGRDNINGAGGDDYIVAGAGNDWWVLGGAGNDTFEFGIGDGELKIGDWNDGDDQVRLMDGLSFEEAFISETVHDGVSTTQMQFDTDNDGQYDHRLAFAGTTMDQLQAYDFI